MENLEALDLSCNQLTRRIPGTFADLDFLGYLNLSDNNLLGRITDLPHLETFEPSSFSGNLELCGPQVHEKCNFDTSYSGEGEEGEYWWESWRVGMGMGIVIGFASVIGVLTLSGQWRTRYYKFIDNILDF